MHGENKRPGEWDAILHGMDLDRRMQLGDLAVMAFIPDPGYGLRWRGGNCYFSPVNRYLGQNM